MDKFCQGCHLKFLIHERVVNPQVQIMKEIPAVLGRDQESTAGTGFNQARPRRWQTSDKPTSAAVHHTDYINLHLTAPQQIRTGVSLLY